MKYLLDTNVMIYLMNKIEPLSSKVMSHNMSDLAISKITMAELAYGVENSAPEYQEVNRISRAMLLAPFNKVGLDDDVIVEYGKAKAYLKKNKIYSPSNEFDIIIAATAIAKGLVLVTANVKDFDKIPSIEIENWNV